MNFEKMLNFKKQDWFRVKAEADSDTAEVFLYGPIAGGFYECVGAEDFLKAMNAIEQGNILLRVNSPGGEVYEGFAIYSGLVALAAKGKKITARIDGLAASIASVVVMAADKIEMAEASRLMVHHPWTIALGNATQFEATAKELKSLGESIVDIYAARTGLERSRLNELMTGEAGADGTFLTAAECLDLGFCTEVLKNKQAAACAGADVWNLPPDMTRMARAGSKRELEAALRDAGYSAAQAKAIASGSAEFQTRDAEPDNSETVEAINKLTEGMKHGSEN